MKRTFMQICLALAATTTCLQAAPGGKQQQVLFAAGQTSKVVSGSVQGKDTLDFLVSAKAGQLLSVSQKPGSKAYFNVQSLSPETAMFNGSMTDGDLKNRMLPGDGSYIVRLYLMGDAADRNQKVPAELTISVTGKPLPPLPDRLDARVGKTPYHATASVPCKYDLDPKLTSCEAGVIRRGHDGTATLVLKMKGFSRTILFLKGKPVASDSSEPMKSTRKGDLTTVSFGDKSEVYEIRDVLVGGD